MSVLDQIKKLDEQKAALLKQAKDEALGTAKKAIADLNSLGFNYSLTEASTTTRRTGVRESVRQAVANAPDGIAPSAIAEQLGMADKAGKQSVSNALSALKKTKLVVADDGLYRIV